MAKNAIQKDFQRPIVGGKRYSRSADTTASSAPTLNAPVALLNGVALSWINGLDPDSGIDSTQVEISLAGANNWSPIAPQVIDYDLGRGTTTSFTGLQPNTSYDFRAANYNGAGLISSYSPIRTVTTLGANPAVEPGIVSFATSSLTLPANQGISIGFIRSGAGTSSPAIEVDWEITGEAAAYVSPSNGTVAWAANEDGLQTFDVQGLNTTVARIGTLRIVSARSLSGVLQPTLGTPNSIQFNVLVTAFGSLKWNGGFYMGSDNITFADDRKLSGQQTEMSILFNPAVSPNVNGLEMFYYPAALQGSTLGVYDFSKVSRDYQALAAKQKRLMFCLLPQYFQSGTKYQDLLPPAVYNNSSFGASPVAGKYGFWTMNGKTALTVAWWRPAVMDWIIALFTALAAFHVPDAGGSNLALDVAPYLERTAFGETSMGVDTDCPDFSFRSVVDQYKRFIDAYNLVWQQTVHMCNNNYTGTPALTQELTDYCIAHRTVIGGPDTYVAGQKKADSILTDGQASVLGVASGYSDFNGPDRRDVTTLQADTQSPEISSVARYKMYTPITFFNQVNNVLRQAHMIITRVSGSGDAVPAYPQEGINQGQNPGNWNSWLPIFLGNALSNLQKPSSLP